MHIKSALYSTVILGSFLLTVPGLAQRQRFARPVPLGVSGGDIDSFKEVSSGNQISDSCAGGTLGVLVENPAGTKFVTGCNHVMNQGPNGNTPIGSLIVQPGVDDTGKSCSSASQVPANGVAKLSTVVPEISGSTANNQADAAMAEVINNDINSSVYQLGAISSTVALPTLRLAVQKEGRDTGLTRGSVTAINQTVTLAQNTEVPTAFSSGKPVDYRFVDQILVSPGNFAGPGDSGAVVFTTGACPQPVGVVIAGNSTTVLLNPMAAVLTGLAKAAKVKSMTIVGGCKSPAEESANLSGNTEIQTAEEVRMRHLPEIMKLPHVAGMGLDLASGQVVFNVEVDEAANVSQVESLVPAKIEGYDVEIGAIPTLTAY
jgi:hypothetical protein